MFAKLIAVILTIGACGCALLAMRQSRLQAASELAQTQLRIARQDEQLWSLRANISRRITPQRIEELAVDVGPLKPMLAEESWDAQPDPKGQKPGSHPERSTRPARTALARGDH